ncbi:ABC transporter permease subunit [Bacillus sp. SG-1]|uniref:ABC transporter permease subunit n=1 Tax=Bacillus sp. SG-1 TaxID=161544 RepID=UPI0001543F3B|nr:ABC transporter permease subunit [Bacillus sp. SG-1]EDL66420.1 possible oligopeptide transport system permease [Bacillus sp. SG-1]
MKPLKSSGIQVLFILTGILAISILPAIINEVWHILSGFFSLANLVYINPISHVERELFPFFWNAYEYSLTIFFSALFLSLFIAIIVLFFYFLLGKPFQVLVDFISFTMSSLPDIFVIVGSQLLVVWIFKRTGVFLFDFVALGEDRAYILPILCLSILPTMYFIKTLTVLMKEEFEKQYVELAKSKGVTYFGILFVHVFRNTIISLAYHGKNVMWLMLSNLLILEYLFNMLGVTTFLFSYNTPTLFAVTSILLFVPIFVFLKIIQRWANSMTGNEVEL